MEGWLAAEGRRADELDLAALEELWQRAKRSERTPSSTPLSTSSKS
jgi:hypothetical protein